MTSINSTADHQLTYSILMQFLHDLQNLPFFLGSFVIVLSVIVFIHEFGHYYVAKLCGVKIEVFSIGFGKEIFGWNDRSGTRWKVSWLPLGGYVKMFGDADPSSQTDTEKVVKMTKAEKAQAFFSKPLKAKAAIVVAGPLANFLLAIVILTGFYTVYGKSVTTNEIMNVVENSAAEKAGLRPGDKVLSINGAETKNFQAIQRIVSINTGTEIDLLIERDHTQQHIYATPEMIESKDMFGNKITLPRLGITSGKHSQESFSLPGAAVEATADTYHISVSTLKAIGQMISGQRDLKDITGPIGIAKYSGQAAQKGFKVLLWFMAVISINLGLINLFPIPVLDGGHLLYYIIEAVKGKPVADKWQQFGFKLGFALIITLAAFAIVNDLIKLFAE